jgi:hypothetical protein
MTNGTSCTVTAAIVSGVKMSDTFYQSSLTVLAADSPADVTSYPDDGTADGVNQPPTMLSNQLFIS